MNAKLPYSYKNLVSGIVSLIVPLLGIFVVLLAVTNSLSALASPDTWTTIAVYLAIVAVFTAFIETTLVPRLKTPGIMRVLFTYWALGTFLAVVIAVLLIVMTGGASTWAVFYIVLALYAWMLYVLNVTIGRLIYPLVHKLLWREAL